MVKNAQSPEPWQVPDGFVPLSHAGAAALEKRRREILELFFRWGYDYVSTPLLDFSQSLPTTHAPDLQNQSFSFSDPLTGQQLCLRPDITYQTARIDARSENRQPLRICYAGSVVNRIPRQPLARREQYQTGAELYGSSDLQADAEIIALMLETTALSQRQDICLNLGHAGIWQQIADIAKLDSQVREQLFTAIGTKSAGDIARALPTTLPQSLKQIIETLPHLHGPLRMLEQARQCLSGAGDSILQILDYLEQVIERVELIYGKINCYIDLGEISGYRYHKGLVFSAYLPGHGAPVAVGGRFDRLGNHFGRGRPAVGFCAEILELLTDNSRHEPQSTAVFVPESQQSLKNCHAMIGQLRREGQRVICGISDQQQPPHCDRILVYIDGDWQIQTVQTRA